MNRVLFFLAGFICFLVSCRSSRNIQSAIAKKDTTAIAVAPAVTNNGYEDSLKFIRETYDSLKQQQIKFTTFSGEINVDYQDGNGKDFNVNAHLRMYKDSVIWIRITGILGIEGLRAYITRDSVKLLDKQNKIYTARSVAYLQEVSDLPLDLYSLQDLLVGNPVFLDSNIASYNKSGGSVSLLSVNDFFKNLITIGETDKLVQSSKLDDQDELRNRTCYLTYGDYENKAGVNFSSKRFISITEKKKLDIRLDFKRYTFNETLSFPFAVPKNYKRN